MIKLVAFDWNGTLFSDTKACTKAVNEVLKVLGKKPVTVRDYQDHFDVPVTKTYIGLGITEKDVTTKSALIAKTFHTNYENKAQNLRTRANARKLLTWLHNRHISSIIFSNHIKNKIELQLKRLQIDNYFEGVLANALIESSHKGRFKQDKLKEFIVSRDFKPHEILVVGDTIEEIEIGKKDGFITVAITNGHCSTNRLLSKKPDYLISNLSEAIEIINNLNK